MICSAQWQMYFEPTLTSLICLRNFLILFSGKKKAKMNLRYVLFPIDQSAENISFNLLIKLKKISITNGSNNEYGIITECFRFTGKTERGEQSYPMSLVRYY